MKINWKYAVGEILIVIVGISVAFMLNNWAATSKENRLKMQYLENLRVDIEDEITHLNDNKSRLDQQVQTAKAMMPYLGRDLPGRDTMIRKVFELAQLVNFIPNTTTYRTLTNSGDLSLIGDLDLRQHIEAHYNNHLLIQQDYDRQLHIHEKYLADFFIYELDYNKAFRGNSDFMDKPVFKNIVQSLYGAIGMAIEATDRGIESNENLLEAIKVELGG